jgi:rod shape determining protein RodA
VLTLVIGISINGAQRWILVAGLTFQISEISKVIMIGVLATFLAARRDSLGKVSTLIGAGLLTAPPFLLIMRQPDLGSALVLVAILSGALFLSGASLRWMGLAAGSVVAMVPVIWSACRTTSAAGCCRSSIHRQIRRAPDTSHQAQMRSARAASSAGLTAARGETCCRSSRPDFAFAVLLESSASGGIVVFLLFVWLIWRILLVGWRSGSGFGIAVAGGTAAMSSSGCWSRGMIAGMMPVTGIPAVHHPAARRSSARPSRSALPAEHRHARLSTAPPGKCRLEQPLTGVSDGGASAWISAR